MPVAYEEMNGSPRESLAWGDTEVVRRLLCKWEERITLCRELLGYWIFNTYVPPDLYVANGNEGLFNVYAYKCDVEPIPTPPDTAGLNYKKAIVTVKYKVQYQSIVDDNPVWITEHIEPMAEFGLRNVKGLYFGTDGGGDKVELEEGAEAPAVITRMIEWVYTIHGVASLGAAYYDLPGKVNNAIVYSRALDRYFPTETLLCGNPSAYREIKRYGGYVWTVTYRFAYRNHGTLASPEGWNHFPRTDKADVDGVPFERITDGTDNVPIYTLANFSGVVR